MSLSKQYANALFDVVKKHDVLDFAREDLNEVVCAIHNVSNMNEFMVNPRITQHTKLQTIRESFKGINEYVLNMLLVLTEKKQFEIVPNIREDFNYLYNEYNNQAEIIVESVYPLEKAELAKIDEVFRNKTGYEKLLIENKINESLIGGFRILIGSKVYDDSVLLQLKSIKNRFKRTKNI